MPAKYRLNRTDFKLLSSRGGRRVRGVFFTLTLIPLPPGASAKFGCVVSKKVARHAADRNRIKRCCREAVRPYISQITQSVALVFYANITSAQASFDLLSQDIATLLGNEVLK